MTPIFFYLFSLCVVLSNGEENCDFKWKQMDNRSDFETTYWMMGGKDTPATVEAFTVPAPVEGVYFYNTDIDVIVHEIGHVKCILENKDETLRELCHFRIDMDYTVQGSHDIDPTPEPPIQTQKMAFQELIFSNQVIAHKGNS